MDEEVKAVAVPDQYNEEEKFDIHYMTKPTDNENIEMEKTCWIWINFEEASGDPEDQDAESTAHSELPEY